MDGEPRVEIRGWRREAAIALVALGAGLFLLPAAIYWVGLELVGEYAPDAGLLTLAERIWNDVLRLRPAAWLLVASPYLVLQLLRLANRARRAGHLVKPVTESPARR